MKTKIDINSFLKGKENYLLWGENGSGKSTLVEKIIREAISKKIIIGYMPQISSNNNSLKRELWLMKHSGMKLILEKEIMGLVEAFNFGKLYKRNPKKMSDGQVTILNTIVCLAHDSNTYVLDEFTNGLDPQMTKISIEKVVDLIIKKDKNILLCTHDKSILDLPYFTKIKLERHMNKNEK